MERGKNEGKELLEGDMSWRTEEGRKVFTAKSRGKIEGRKQIKGIKGSRKEERKIGWKKGGKEEARRAKVREAREK